MLGRPLALTLLLLVALHPAGASPATAAGYRECAPPLGAEEALAGCRLLARANVAASGCSGNACTFVIASEAYGTADLPGVLSLDTYAYFTRPMEAGGVCVGPKRASESLGFPCGRVCDALGVGHSVGCIDGQAKLVDVPPGACTGLWLVTWLHADARSVAVAPYFHACRDAAGDGFAIWADPDVEA